MSINRQVVKAVSLVPEPNTVWITGNGVTDTFTPVKDTICWGYYIQGYGSNVVVKWYETALTPKSEKSSSKFNASFIFILARSFGS